MGLNFDDIDIRRMVAQSHYPEEEYTTDGNVNVWCNKCKFEWPCRAVTGLREWHRSHPEKKRGLHER